MTVDAVPQGPFSARDGWLCHDLSRMFHVEHSLSSASTAKGRFAARPRAQVSDGRARGRLWASGGWTPIGIRNGIRSKEAVSELQGSYGAVSRGWMSLTV